MSARQTRGEELANAISHGVGLVGASIATPYLIARAAERGDAAGIVGASVFGATMVLLYLASTTYHLAPDGRLKRLLNRIDHGAIFLLIAGTYTPFTLGVLGGPWGWTLFGIVWALAVVGVTLKLAVGLGPPRLSVALYVAMGWVALIAVRPLVENVPLAGLLLLLGGGLAYTGGVGFFAAQRVRYAHFVWHLFVLAGTTCHYFAVLWYAA